MKDIILLDKEIYIKASSSLADQRLRVLKSGEVFGIFDVFGDIKPVGVGAQGFYRGATRFLSQLELRMGGHYLTLLSSTITSDNMLLIADLSNPDFICPNGNQVSRSSIHASRSIFLHEDTCFEELELTNFGNTECTVPISYSYHADFADMFEIRGIPRERRGEYLPAKCRKQDIIFNYKGLDEQIRSCRIHFHPIPSSLDQSECHFLIPLPSRQSVKIFITIQCFENEYLEQTSKSFHSAYLNLKKEEKNFKPKNCQVESSSERFNAWLDRSKADIQLMTTAGTYGTYPYAGIPWFNSVFGRDGLITALQYLWIDPSLARGTLSYLAKAQATSDIPFEDAEPGKILHELRSGEMVNTGEVPFKKYYGSADATPLFIVLAGRYLEMTADLSFIQSLWPSIEAALKWIHENGDHDGDGFVEYFRRSSKGLDNQGWKDSSDSISHSDGSLAKGPIALCEVQGYVFDAKIQAATMAKHLGLLDLSEKLFQEASLLQQKFKEFFWCAEIDSLALALDGKKHPCKVISSNAGHCLFSGIVDQETAEKVAHTLLAEEMFSGWGIRTLSNRSARYNPMSYHNGSIWPHDNALIAEGLARYNLKSKVLQVTEALFDVSTNIDLFRLPELFCGFSRRTAQGPTLYPVACSPQSWAAGSVFMFLKACLGLKIDGFKGLISFDHPVLPHFISELRLTHLQVGPFEVDLLFRRYGSEVNVYVERRTGDVRVSILK